jgi:hypothetical protein
MRSWSHPQPHLLENHARRHRDGGSRQLVLARRLALMGAFFVYSATVEEHTMERLFPDAYPAYKSSTKKLIPFIF